MFKKMFSGYMFVMCYSLPDEKSPLEADTSNDGMVSWDEFQDLLSQQSVAAYFSALELEVQIDIYIYIYIFICYNSKKKKMFACMYVYTCVYVYIYIYSLIADSSEQRSHGRLKKSNIESVKCYPPDTLHGRFHRNKYRCAEV